jgi:hypothetical protein
MVVGHTNSSTNSLLPSQSQAAERVKVALRVRPFAAKGFFIFYLKKVNFNFSNSL